MPGYLRFETWSGADVARVRLLLDPELVDPELLRQAVTTLYVDAAGDWVMPNYEIEGYDSFGLGL